MLTVGDKIPSFSLTNDSGDVITDQSLAGRTVVLYFYPKDDTPGCTREAIAFTQHHDAFVEAGAQVIGVSRDPVHIHTKFKHKYAIKIPLLSDPDASLHRAFGAWGTKVLYGKEHDGALRSTFVIDKYGTVVRVFPNVKVDGHVEAVLGALTGAVPASTGATVMPPAKKEAAAKKAKAKAKRPATKAAAAPKAKSAPKKAAPKKPAAKKPAAKKPAAKKPAAKKPATKQSAKKMKPARTKTASKKKK